MGLPRSRAALSAFVPEGLVGSPSIECPKLERRARAVKRAEVSAARKTKSRFASHETALCSPRGFNSVGPRKICRTRSSVWRSDW
jgi:hypothetical protein